MTAVDPIRAREVLHGDALDARARGCSAWDWEQSVVETLPDACAALSRREIDAIVAVVWSPTRRYRGY